MSLTLKYDEQENFIHVTDEQYFDAAFSIDVLEKNLVRWYGFNYDQARMVCDVTIMAGSVTFPNMKRREADSFTVTFRGGTYGWIKRDGEQYFIDESTWNCGVKSTAIRFPDTTTVLTYLAGKWNVAQDQLSLDPRFDETSDLERLVRATYDVRNATITYWVKEEDGIEVSHTFRNERRIDQIKWLREKVQEETGNSPGLKETKDFVDHQIANAPEPF